MTNTNSAAAEGLLAVPKKSWPERQGELFEVRFAEWLARRAEVANFNLLGEAADDEKYDELGERLEDATRLAMTTHAPNAYMVWQKIQILEDALHGTGECTWTDKRQVWMLGCIKADLMAHGIGKGLNI